MVSDQMAMVTNVAAMVVGFGAVIIVFRIDRELKMHQRKEETWVPWADVLVIASATISGIFGLALPLSFAWLQFTRFPMAACVGSVILLTGYPFAILAHYRLILSKGREGARDNPEPAEMVICLISLFLAVFMFVVSLRQ